MTITGTSRSRLSELKKYSQNPDPLDNYRQSATPANDGLNRFQSTSDRFVYYIGGITYVDELNDTGSTTTFSFEKNGIDTQDFIDSPIIKDPNKENMVSDPKVDNDVFIVRQQLSAFKDNYELQFIEDLNDLINYAGGNYFNIVNNT